MNNVGTIPVFRSKNTNIKLYVYIIVTHCNYTVYITVFFWKNIYSKKYTLNYVKKKCSNTGVKKVTPSLSISPHHCFVVHHRNCHNA